MSLSAAFLLTGCGIGALAPQTAVANNDAAHVGGKVIGGEQPIKGSTVTLYSSGTSGYGSSTGFTALAHSTTADGTNGTVAGTFSFSKGCTLGNTGCNDNSSTTWNCPASGNPIIYLVAVSGDAGAGSNNPVAVIAGAIGPCSTITSSTNVDINEISTAAFASVFGQYMYPGDGTHPGSEGISTSSTTQGSLGLLNAFSMYSNNLVTIVNAYEIQSATYSGSGTTASVTVSAVPEYAKLLTMGNILASCVNGDPTKIATAGLACHTLFNAALPPLNAASTGYGGTYPTVAIDTLQSALYMALNPADTGTLDSSDCSAYTSNLACLFGLQTGTSPFVSSSNYGTPLTAAPNDWTIGVAFTASGTCNNGTNTGAFFVGPVKSAIDASGNLWFVNGNGTAGSATKAGSLNEMSPIGVPLYCSPINYAGRGITIDPTGNVWAMFNGSTYSTSLDEWNVASSTIINWSPTTNGWNVVSDGNGNIFFDVSGSGGKMYEFVSPGTATTTYSPTIVSSSIVSSGSGSEYFYSLGVDAAGRIWGTSPTGYVQEVYPTNATAVTAPITACAIASGTATFTSANSFSVGQKVNITGLTTTKCKGLDTQVITLTAASATSFAGTASGSATSGTITDSGTATLIAYSSAQHGSSLENYGIAVDASGNIYSGASCCGTDAYRVIPSSTAGTSTYTYSIQHLGGINGARATVADGASNIWVATQLPQTGTSSTSGVWGVAEFYNDSGTGTGTFHALSPTGTPSGANPTSCTSSGCATNGGFQKTSLSESYDINVDPSGNVWVLNSNSAASTGSTTFDGTGVVAIVGAGVPVVTPLSVGAKNGALGAKP